MLLAWLRRERYHISRIHIGDVEIDGIVDMTHINAIDDQRPAPATDLREAYGGGAIDRLRRERAAERVDDVTSGTPPSDDE